MPHRLTDGGRKVVTLTRPNKTPALQARSDSTDEDDESEYLKFMFGRRCASR